MTRKARCNLDGRALHPDDAAQVARFAQWLSMTKAQQKWAVRTDPSWREWLGIKPADPSKP